MTREQVLKNTARSQIFDFVTKNPGSYYREIMKNLDIGSNEIIWHSTILLKFAFIRYAIIDGRKIFFDNELITDFDKEIYYMGDKKINEIIQHLIQNAEGSTRSKISNDLSMNYNTVVKCLEKLENIKLIEQNQEADNILYYLNLLRFKEVLDGIESVKNI